MRRIKTKLFLSIMVVAILLIALPITALAAQPGAVVIGNSYTLESGQNLNDNLFILGGTVNLMPGSTITGNVVLIGGSVQAAGTITGNVTVLGGTLNLASTFVLNGNLTTGGTSVNRDPNAKIYGQVNTNGNTPSIVIPGQVQIPNFDLGLNPFFKIVSFFLRLFLWALVAMVLAMFVPSYLNRTSQAAIAQPLMTGGMGLLTIIVAVIVLVILVITICLIPVALLGLLLLVLAWAFGFISLGFEVGKRISSTSKMVWHPAISAGLGTLLLMAVLSGLEALVPCVGWIPKALVGLVGLGAVLLTQFGMKAYNPAPKLQTGNLEIPPPV
ncbi:MAG TPA: polymer-forming cytoskeletal protein [Anaerolineales bacterium]|nr:polymer-forming cytoskeletal protein [Anaerolineales bacterium]